MGTKHKTLFIVVRVVYLVIFFSIESLSSGSENMSKVNCQKMWETFLIVVIMKLSGALIILDFTVIFNEVF